VFKAHAKKFSTKMDTEIVCPGIRVLAPVKVVFAYSTVKGSGRVVLGETD
jgi:hypothetical protein